MAFKLVVLAAFVAVANAGFLAAPAAVGYAASPYAASAYGYSNPAAYGAVSSVGQNTFRSFGNTAQVSTYSKALDTPFSSVRKSDVRVSNPGVATYGYAAPAVASYAAPAAYGYAAPAVAAYASPIAKVAAPVAYAAPAAYAARAYAAPAVAAHPAALGVAYSAAPAVAHYSFDGFGTHYAF